MLTQIYITYNTPLIPHKQKQTDCHKLNYQKINEERR